MKCEDCQKAIEEYFDGELEGRAATRVREHLMKCEACSLEFEALKDEQNLYALYRRDVEVQPRLWEGVAARIREEERLESERPTWRKRLAALFGTPRLSPALTFALLILAIGATAGLMKYMQSRTASTQPVAKNRPEGSTIAQPKVSDSSKVSDGPSDNAGAKEERGQVEQDNRQLAVQDEKVEERATPAYRVADKVESRGAVAKAVGFVDEESPEQLVREAEQKYRAAIILLARDARRRRTLLEPEVLARFDQTLAAVDRTIGETRRAARQQPDDPVAVQYMLAAYAKKVEVLREMATYRMYERDIQ